MPDDHAGVYSIPTRRSSDLLFLDPRKLAVDAFQGAREDFPFPLGAAVVASGNGRSRRRLPSHLTALLVGTVARLVPIVPRSEGTRLNSSHVYISYAVFCLRI